MTALDLAITTPGPVYYVIVIARGAEWVDAFAGLSKQPMHGCIANIILGRLSEAHPHLAYGMAPYHA
jgi:hypothetical protein